MGTRIKTLLAERKLVRVFSMSGLIDPKIAEMVALRGGFDVIWIDHEHGGVTVEAAEQIARAARAAGLDSFVRLAPTDYATVMRFLEIGAGGIMAAQVSTAEEAERVVSWAKFAPRGRRGVAGATVDGDFGMLSLAEYTERCNRQTFISVQIENAEALENVESIARVPDLDLLFVGPADLSQALGVTGQFNHPKLLSAIEHIANVCAAANVAWGTIALNPELAKWTLERGCAMLEFGHSVLTFQLGLQAVKTRYEALLNR
jgi:2-dehydro-3-deoxyglucarate aldolase/4-hydroxy-2-oxoheptanedioate aldolase